MKLIDTYALSAGAKIDKPFIFEQFFPLPFEKYITLQAQTKFDSKDYSYWQDVINVLYPYLEKNGIKIIQVGGAGELQYQYVVDLRGRTEVSQLAYIIKGSLLHLGSDSFCTHLADHYNVPFVGLYSVSQSSISGPQFDKKENQVCIDAYLRTRNGKPSYSDKESPKCVDLVMPEEIVNHALAILKIDAKAPFETIFMGDRYSAKIIREFIPKQAIQIHNPEVPIEIRMDIEFNEEVLAQQLSTAKAIVITNKRINKALLAQFRPNISALVYVIDESDEPQFIKDIQDLGLNIILLSRLEPEQINNKKINYYEHGKINQFKIETPEVIEKIKSNINSLYYRSNKLVAESNKLFMSNAARITQEEMANDFTYHKVTDIPEFWQDLQFMTIVKRTETPTV